MRVFAGRLILDRNPSGLNYFELIQHILDVQFSSGSFELGTALRTLN